MCYQKFLIEKLKKEEMLEKQASNKYGQKGLTAKGPITSLLCVSAGRKSTFTPFSILLTCYYLVFIAVYFV